MGAGVLQPVMTQHVQASRLNMERMRANAIEAAEQCGILSIPECREPEKFGDASRRWDNGPPIVFCDEREPMPRARSIRCGRCPPARIALLIGPEGGFSSRGTGDAEGGGLRHRDLARPPHSAGRHGRGRGAWPSSRPRSATGGTVEAPTAPARLATPSTGSLLHSGAKAGTTRNDQGDSDEIGIASDATSKADHGAGHDRSDAGHLGRGSDCPPGDRREAAEQFRIGTEHEKFGFYSEDLSPVPYEGETRHRQAPGAHAGAVRLGSRSSTTAASSAFTAAGGRGRDLAGARRPVRAVRRAAGDDPRDLPRIQRASRAGARGRQGSRHRLPRHRRFADLDDRRDADHAEIALRDHAPLHAEGRHPRPRHDVPHGDHPGQSRLLVRSRHAPQDAGRA